MKSLFPSTTLKDWQASLNAYEQTIIDQGIERLPDLDRWYREELPKNIAKRKEPHVTHEELVQVTKWKMTRGVWRARNMVLVSGNAPEKVIELSTAALALAPHPTKPISTLAELAGVGPATASAIASAARPDLYPFFDEVMAEQVEGLGKVAYTMGFYTKYAAALRDKAEELAHGWTPAMVERALWSNAGGKVGKG